MYQVISSQVAKILNFDIWTSHDRGTSFLRLRTFYSHLNNIFAKTTEVQVFSRLRTFYTLISLPWQRYLKTIPLVGTNTLTHTLTHNVVCIPAGPKGRQVKSGLEFEKFRKNSKSRVTWPHNGVKKFCLHFSTQIEKNRKKKELFFEKNRFLKKKICHGPEFWT